MSVLDPSREAGLIDFLTKRHFETASEPLPDSRFLIHARRDACGMDLREVAPHGWDRSAMKALAAGRRLFYVDNGSVSAEQPAWRTWSYFYLRRFASFLGWPLARRLTFAVISDASCGDLDWARLSKPASTGASISALRPADRRTGSVDGRSFGASVQKHV